MLTRDFRLIQATAILTTTIATCVGLAGPAAADRDLVRNGKSWSIQLQGDARSMQKRNSDVAVVDPDEVRNPAKLKKKASGGKRAVLAYISVGEAEEGRAYMKKKGKTWLTKDGQGWSGNYKVRYWDKEWKSIVKQRVRAAIDAGYDGVYLDRIDTYEGMKAPGGSRKEMVKFVKEITAEARSRKKNSAVAVQNAEELLTDNDYVDNIDAIGKEDLYHGIHHDGRRNNSGAVKASVDLLKKAKAKGKGVYVVEYLGGQSAKKVKDEGRKNGFAVTTGGRNLSNATD
jgi:cysteinyl-tRNA synthetase, unknown class